MLIENDLMGRNISQSIGRSESILTRKHFTAQLPILFRFIKSQEEQYDIFEILKNIMLRIQSYYCQLKKDDTTSIVTRYTESLFRKDGCIDTKMLTESSLHRLYV